MTTIAVIISFLLGAVLLLSISSKLGLLELAGLSFPVGIGVQTVIMVLLDAIGVRLSINSMLWSSVLFILLLSGWMFYKKENLLRWKQEAFKVDLSGLNLLWLVFVAAMIVVEVMNFSRCVYFPVIDRDSLAGFDLLGKVIASEGTIRNLSLFNSPNFYESARSAGSYISYTPFTQCSYAYVYMAGAETSKIVNALHYLSFIIAFYGVLRRFAVPALAAVVTFFAFITPEFISFSSLSSTNVMHAFYASLGVLFFVAWYYKRERSLLWISTLLLMLNIWTRSEGIVFIGACCCILLWDTLRSKNWRQLIVFSLLCVLPFIFWNLFLKFNNLEAVQVFIFKPFWDAKKLMIIHHEMWNNLITSIPLFGWTFLFFAIAVVSNIYWIVKRGDQAIALLLIGLSAIFYLVLIYQVDYVWDDIVNVLRFSCKRFIFCFVPLAWFYVGANKNVKWLFEKIT